jgi:hypothetical protein
MSDMKPSRHVPVNLAHGDTVGAVRVELVHTEKPTYVWVVTDQTVGASVIFFDLFNAVGSDKIIRFLSVRAIASVDVAATVTILPRLHLLKTSAIGTGGTAWNKDGGTPDAAGGAVNKVHSVNDDLPTQITGRQTPTGGATNSEWVATRWVGLDEDGAPLTPEVEMLPKTQNGQLVALEEGEGIKVLQGSVAGAGKVGFEVVFTLDDA